ncbi:MAG: DNA mismatch repair endonuclease MutL [Clostridia bacterium]
MPRIHVLNAHIANQIAAGEVVERPCSVVKELVENAVDAHASAVTIEIENGGIDRIRIVDNGSGIADEDCETAFLRHATSKISSAEDLMHIATLGFRGEALASVGAVARVYLTTRTASDELGTAVVYEGGVLKEHRRTGSPEGTTIEVRDLFFNVPARLKFLKSARSENGAIGDYVARLILSLPEIAFHYLANGKTIYQTTGDGDLKNALIAIYGTNIAPHLCEIDFDDGYLKISGYVGTPEISRVNRSGQTFFLNNRIIRSNALSTALSRAFDTRLLIGRYPFATLSMRIALAEVDVNVHPAKLEVRFVDEERIIRSICAACSKALIRSYVPKMPASEAVHVDAGEQMNNCSRVELRKPISMSTYSVREDLSAAPCIDSKQIIANASAFKTAAEMLEVPRYNVVTTQQKRSEQTDLFRYASVPFAQPFFVIGAAFNTYWFVQQGEVVYCIDQHAAHERLLYDAITTKRDAVISQALLIPEEIQLLPSDYELFLQKKGELVEFGYLFSEKGERTVVLASVPQLNGIPLKSEFLLDVLHDSSPVRVSLTQSACKHAVKAGEPISRSEIEVLLHELADNEALLTCPHGRPVAVRIPKIEIEKWFKRVL